MYFLNHNETNYFFSQADFTNKSIKRVKKQLNPQLLNKKLNSKFQTNDLLNDDNEENESRSIVSRLATLQPRQSVASIREPSAVSHAHHNPAQNTSIPTNNNPKTVANPNAFTDTRLQAIRFLTEDMVKQLEEYLGIFFNAEIIPILPGQVIYEWHADWSDLTEKTSYDNFPVWQTKNGFSRIGSSQHRRSQMSNEDTNLNNQKNDTTSKGRQGKRNSIRLDDSNLEHLDQIKDVISSRKSNKLAKSPTSKLSSINESKNDSSSRNQMQNKHVSINNKNINSPIGQLNLGSSIGMAPPVAFKPSRNETHSRMTLNPSSLSGCLVNYQLSQPVYKEKGWTVVTLSEEDKKAENEKRILNCLKFCLKNIEMIQIFEEKNNLKKPCKLRFYGDNRKEQIEKYYKNTNLKPKKSLFAMSLLRNEIPKPLDLNFMLECLSNPVLSNTINHNRVLSAASNRTGLINKDELLNIPKPQLFSSQTNDGTNSVFYSNGSLAILVSNVFGFYFENSNGNTTNPGSSLSMTSTNMMSNLAGYGNNSATASLSYQNLKNSYTTVIYDYVPKRSFSNNTFKSKRSNSLMSNEKEKQENILLNLNFSTDSSKFKNKNFVDNSFNNQNIKNIKKERDTNLLAVITPSGNCVCYRRNGKPRFVCTETGGCLINSKGLAFYQWKWDDESTIDENVREELSSNLNEYIRLEYINPSNIKLTFDCEKETVAFDLSRVKENQNKLAEFINKTASDMPMKSKLGQQKLTAHTKTSVQAPLKSVTTHQHLHNSNLSATGKDSLESSIRIDKLLETTISYKDIPVMKDLLTIQKKIRSLLEDWLLHCRTSLNIMQPNMYILPDIPQQHKTNRLNEHHSDYDKIIFHRRKSKSVENLISNMVPLHEALSTNRQYSNKKDMFNNNFSTARSLIDSKRSQSAYFIEFLEEMLNSGLKFFEDQLINRNNVTMSKEQTELINKIKSLKDKIANNGLMVSQKQKLKLSKLVDNLNIKRRQFSSNTNNKMDLTVFKTSPRVLARTAANFSFQNKSNMLSIGDLNELFTSRSYDGNKSTSRIMTNDDLNLLCPVSLHLKMNFQKYDHDCRCKKQVVPLINDLEFDYLMKMLPSHQLVVIVIMDSKIPQTNIQSIVQELYINLNKNRIQACKETIKDEIRYFYYDINTASNDSNHTQPILVTRHNVASGMVLIYKNAKLLFCDHIFNGYGYSQQDFIKQLNKTKEDALLGKFLPNNFRFNHPIGNSGPRTAWGGQIGGLESCFNDINLKLNNSYDYQFNKNTIDELESLLQTPRLHLPKINKLQKV